MIKITFPDGSKREYQQGISGSEIVKSISTSLAKKTTAMRINQTMVDISTTINEDSEIKFITNDSGDEDCLEVLRHDAAHILAQSLKEIYGNKIQITIGPVIENGFYYDIAMDEKISTNDFEKIEQKMQEITKRNVEITREIWSCEDAIKYFNSIGEKYKAEIISDLDKNAINNQVSIYKHGDFYDLCRGPHAPSTGMTKFYKLEKIAGAYWRGDSKNEMLQRIYGTCWHSKAALDEYLTMMEEARARDHRKLGAELDLFHLQEESPGGVFWHHKGWTIYRIIENYVRQKILENGYIEVKTPQVVDKSLWEKSGHWENFAENMFICGTEDKEYAVKPMNCPCHVQIFNQGIKSYKDLPIRMAEFGCCHRNEPSGSLHGIMRVRGFVQDDAHIFCTFDQIQDETSKFITLLFEIYEKFGFTDVKIMLSTRPEKRAGSDEIWDLAETTLADAVKKCGYEYIVQDGEGAFYGPKLEFQLRDCIGRYWQCGTLQLDFVLPERLGANIINKDGKKEHPVMLHRAILGSLERFIGILTENYAGKFPFWLSPVQICICTINDKVLEYAKKVQKECEKLGFRAILNDENETLNNKIRKSAGQKINYTFIIGEKESENKEISVRKLGDSANFTISLEKLSDLDNV